MSRSPRRGSRRRTMLPCHPLGMGMPSRSQRVGARSMLYSRLSQCRAETGRPSVTPGQYTTSGTRWTGSLACPCSAYMPCSPKDSPWSALTMIAVSSAMPHSRKVSSSSPKSWSQYMIVPSKPSIRCSKSARVRIWSGALWGVGDLRGAKVVQVQRAARAVHLGMAVDRGLIRPSRRGAGGAPCRTNRAR